MVHRWVRASGSSSWLVRMKEIFGCSVQNLLMAYDAGGMTPLHVAIRTEGSSLGLSERQSYIKFLLEAADDPQACLQQHVGFESPARGQTPLMLALETPELLRVMLAASPEPQVLIEAMDATCLFDV